MTYLENQIPEPPPHLEETWTRTLDPSGLAGFSVLGLVRPRGETEALYRRYDMDRCVVDTAAEYQRRGEKFFDELEIAFADVVRAPDWLIFCIENRDRNSTDGVNYLVWPSLLKKKMGKTFARMLTETTCSSQANIVTAWKLWKDGTPLEFMDPTLAATYSRNEVVRCIHIGLLCIQQDAGMRPSMVTIVQVLSNYTISLPLLEQPPFFFQSTTESCTRKSEECRSQPGMVSVDEASITQRITATKGCGFWAKIDTSSGGFKLKKNFEGRRFCTRREVKEKEHKEEMGPVVTMSA
ncbi:hypothetical protein LguiB_026911 [Lonicera macranthoides]